MASPPDSAVPVARPAATVVLAREGSAGVEVLLLRRPPHSAFAADAWVFPGGVVDAADGEREIGGLTAGPTAEEWARRLELDDPREAMGYVVAALREAWEETGILLARGGPGKAERLARARRELLSGELSLAAALARESLRLDATGLRYLGRWITPAPSPRRYDTRFFLALVPAEAVCELHGEELAEARWMRPADAVAAFQAGALHLLPPTVHTLQRLATAIEDGELRMEDW